MMKDCMLEFEYSRAMAIGERQGEAARDAATRRKYAALVTQRIGEANYDDPMGDEANELRTTMSLDMPEKLMKSLIKRCSKKSSGGPSRWSFSLVRSMLACDESTTVDFIRSLSHLLENDLLPSERAKQLFRLARGVPIPKKNPGEIRPLAVGEALRRIACKIIKEAIGNPTISAACGPLQFGAGVSSGTEVAAGIPRLALASVDDLTSVGLDCSNAFQNVDRVRTLAKVQEYLPAAYNLARSLYAGDSLLILSHEESRPDDPTLIVSTQGVHQGCVFGSIFFCVAIRDALAALASDLKKIDLDNGLTA